MGCNATLTLYREGFGVDRHEMTCWHQEGHEGKHQCGGLLWVDTLPGAKPHKPVVSNPEADAVRQLGRALRERDEARAQRDEAIGDANTWWAKHQRLRALLQTVLDTFTHRGHPGRPCVRSMWIAVELVEQWRAVLDPMDAVRAADPVEDA